MKNTYQLKPNRNLFWHSMAWLIVFLLPFIFSSEDSNHGSKYIYLDTATKIFWMLLFYINTELLIPKLIYKKKWLLFILFQLTLFFIIMQVHGVLFNLMINE
jgi:hypothetical protein